MRVAVIGANGQLGTDLVRAFRDHEVIPWTRNDFDVRDHERTSAAILADRPNVIINTAAFHNTDDCEENPDTAFAVNAIAVQNLAVVCEATASAFIQISTDYVFDGVKGTPYLEDDYPQPINVYGTSKLAGERFVQTTCSSYYIVRVASLFGTDGAHGKGGNFVDKMLNRAKAGEEIRVVDDVVMSPTYTVDAAQSIRKIVDLKAPAGTYHVVNFGACSWFEFAKAIFKLSGTEAQLRSWSIAEAVPRARRPKNSSLCSCKLDRIGANSLRPWQEALKDYLIAKHYLHSNTSDSASGTLSANDRLWVE